MQSAKRKLRTELVGLFALGVFSSLAIEPVRLFGDEVRTSTSGGATEANSKPATAVEHENKGSSKKSGSSRPDPGQYRLMDYLATSMIWLVTGCGLGGLMLITLIVVGARRLRRLTRLPALQSKYDELEYLRLKHRREVAGLGDTDVTRTEH